MFCRCVGRNGSLDFAEGLALCGWGKSQCAVCGLAVEFQNFCAEGKKIKIHSGRQWVSDYLSVFFVFHSKFNISFSLSIYCVVVFFPLVHNGQRVWAVSVTWRSHPATKLGTLAEKLSRWQGRYGAIFASPGERFNCLFSTDLSRAGITMFVNGRDFCFTIKLSRCSAKIVTNLLPIPAC